MEQNNLGEQYAKMFYYLIYQYMLMFELGQKHYFLDCLLLDIRQQHTIMLKIIKLTQNVSLFIFYLYYIAFIDTF